MKLAEYGPFLSAIIAGIVPAAMIIALVAGFKIDLMSVLTVLVPGMALGALMVSVSMAWIFILIGRLNRQPRWLAATIVGCGLAMLEMLVIVIYISHPTH